MFLGLFALAGIGIYGCGDGTKARVEVVKEKALKQLDDLLGSMDVKRAGTVAGVCTQTPANPRETASHQPSPPK